MPTLFDTFKDIQKAIKNVKQNLIMAIPDKLKQIISKNFLLIYLILISIITMYIIICIILTIGEIK